MTLDELKKLSADATPAPWSVGRHPDPDSPIRYILDSRNGWNEVATLYDDLDTNVKKAKLIVAARNHLDKLIAVAEAAKELVKWEASYEIGGFEKHIDKLSEVISALEDEK